MQLLITNSQLPKTALRLAAGIVVAAAFVPLSAHAQSSSLTAIQAVPLIGQDIVQRLLAPLRTILESDAPSNAPFASWTPPTLAGRGERLGHAAQELLRAAIMFAIASVAWLISFASQAISWVVSVGVAVVAWGASRITTLF
jgi:hypothetical protein